MNQPRLVLLLPELEECLQQPEWLLQNAPQLLAMAADAQPINQQLLPDWLPNLDNKAPLAAFSSQHELSSTFDTPTGDAYWVRADPVVMYVDINRVHLLAVDEHGLTEQQTDHLLQALKPLFAEYELTLSRGDYPHAHQHWYLQAKQPLPTAFLPPAEALGQSLENYLSVDSQLETTINWQRLQTESQMVLHQHPVNQQRQQQGLSAVNSLWFWGDGKLPEQQPLSRPDAVWAVRPELAGWCDWARLDGVGYAVTDSFSEWLDGLSKPVDKLLIEYGLQRQLNLPENLECLNNWLVELITIYRHSDCYLQLDSKRILHLSAKRGWLARFRTHKQIQQQGLKQLQAMLR